MDRNKRKKLEAKGWRIDNTKEFLGLTDDEIAVVEMRVAFECNLRKQRERKRLN